MITNNRKQKADQVLSEISHITTMPETTKKVMSITYDATSTAQDMSEALACDPALSSRILKIVNSSFYGLPGQIGSINRAIVMLGLNAVNNITIAASLAKLFRGGNLTPQFSAKIILDHSTATASTCKVLNDRLKLGFGDEAYLSGMLHDIGVMLEMLYDRQLLIDVINSTKAEDDGASLEDMRMKELDVFGATHEDFGKAFCAQWNLPRLFSEVCQYHHDPMTASIEYRKLVCLVSIADRFSTRIRGGYRLDLPSLEIPDEEMHEIGLTEDILEELIPRVSNI